MTQDTSEMKRLKAYAKAEIKAGNQIAWVVAFAVSNPTRQQIQHWFDCPRELNKAQAVQWLVEKASKHVNH